MKKLLENGDLNKTEEGKQIFEMINFINEEKFWKAQVAQMDIDNDGRISIYPQITGQKVEFGKALVELYIYVPFPPATPSASACKGELSTPAVAKKEESAE